VNWKAFCGISWGRVWEQTLRAAFPCRTWINLTVGVLISPIIIPLVFILEVWEQYRQMKFLVALERVPRARRVRLESLGN
jgi:hypothetical protein